MARLELHYADGATTEIPTVERFVLFPIPRDRYSEQRMPKRLFAYDAEGRLVAQHGLDQRAN